MELIKKSIHMNRLKNKLQAQINLDDDFIVPDTKPDINNVITSEGEVSIDYVGVGDGKVNVRGRLIFRILYMCGDGEKRLDNMTGELSFDENMLLDETEVRETPTEFSIQPSHTITHNAITVNTTYRSITAQSLGVHFTEE